MTTIEKEWPLISVICPTRNGIAHLKSALESVLQQDYPAIELIVVDGGSTDGSVELLEAYGERIRFVSEPDSGQSEAINKGMALAHGEILAWLNCDDEYVPGAIAEAARAFQVTGASVIFGDALAVDGRGRRYGNRVNVAPANATQLIHHRCSIVQPASFWVRDVWAEVGPLREDLHYALDYEFFMRAVQLFELQYWPFTFAVERHHSDAKTVNGNKTRIDEIRDCAAEHGATDLPWSFRAEGAGVYAAEALKALSKGRVEESRSLFNQAREWNFQPGRSALFFGASLTGRGLSRFRLLANLYISGSRRLSGTPSHNNPRMTRHSFVSEARRPAIPAARWRSRGLDHYIRTALHSARPKLGVLRQHEPKVLVQSVPSPPPKVGSLPSITVVTPSYKQAEFLGDTVDSVLSQGYPFLEYIVQDAESNDGSVEILQQKQVLSDQMRWWSEPDDGQANAINRGHSKGHGEILAWLNSDDLLLPGTLDYVGAFFAANPDVDVVYSHRVLIDREGSEIGRWLLPKHDQRAMVWADYVPQETLFWRRDVWDRVGGLDETFKFAMDWDFLLRLEEAGARIVRLPIFGGAFRVYDEQLTSSVLVSTGSDEMARLRRRCHGRNVSSLEVQKGLAPYLARHVVLDRAWQAGLKKM